MTILFELIGQVLDEKYQIVKQLGQGGMGAVFLATHVGTARPVAVKVIAPQFMANEEFVDRFKREAKAAGLLRHPNVVNVTDFGFATFNSARLAYLVMEYLDGCPLSDILTEEKKLPLAWIVDILEQVCLAIEKAHKEGIIHRDLKPDNIWLEPNERGGYSVKVLDFGLAKVAGEKFFPAITTLTAAANQPALPDAEWLTTIQNSETIVNAPAVNNTISAMDEFTPTVIMDQRAEKTLPYNGGDTNLESSPDNTAKINNLTQVGAVLGTPTYMSPEQAAGQTITASSDIYSLGVIAYQMITGDAPFHGNLYAMMYQHINLPPAPLRAKRPDISKQVEEFILAALAKDPAQRPVSAAAFASALSARAENAGTLTRKAIAIYGEHITTIIFLSLLGSVPGWVVLFLDLTNQYLIHSRYPTIARADDIILAIVNIFIIIFGQAFNAGVLVPAVAQLIIAPLRPVQIWPAIVALKKRVLPILPAALCFTISMLFTVLFIAGCGLNLFVGLYEHSRAAFTNLLVIILILGGPALFFAWLCRNLTLYAAAAYMEGLRGIAVMKRSRQLVYRSRSAITKLWMLFIGIETTMLTAYMILNHYFPQANNLLQILTDIIEIFTNPFYAILLAVAYFNVRRINGDTLKEILTGYQAELPSETKWQQRMKERFNRITPTLH